MAAKKKAAKAGTGAVSAAQAARSNEYVQRLITDESLREDLRSAYESATSAYDRITSKGAQKAFDDKKVQKDLKEAATSFKSAADSLRDKKPKRKRKGGGIVLVTLVGAGLAIGLSEGLRNKVLDALFGAEEEFEYTSSTTSDSSASSSSTESVGA